MTVLVRVYCLTMKRNKNVTAACRMATPLKLQYVRCERLQNDADSCLIGAVDGVSCGQACEHLWLRGSIYHDQLSFSLSAGEFYRVITQVLGRSRIGTHPHLQPQDPSTTIGCVSQYKGRRQVPLPPRQGTGPWLHRRLRRRRSPPLLCCRC